MRELSRGAQRLFDLARRQDAPEPGDEARVERALATRIALGLSAGGAGLTVVTTAAASKLGPASIASIASKALLVGIAAGTVAVGAATVVSSVTAPPSAERERPPIAAANVGTAPAARATGARPAPILESAGVVRHDPEARVPDVAPPAPRARQSTPAPLLDTPSEPAATPLPEDPLDAETEALRAAQHALRSRDFERALRLLDNQDALYRAGALQQERAAARVLASCLSGQVEGARAEAARFERRWPRSPLLARVRRSCSEP